MAWFGIVAEGNTPVADVRVTPPPAEQREANARLIAAAPDLLAACEESLRKINFRLWLGDMPLPVELEAWKNMLSAALVRAEGKQ